MKVTVITTAAQYFGGIDLHIRNLEWALSEVDYQIIVQTFLSNNLNFTKEKIKLIKYKKNPKFFFPFWDYTSKFLHKTLEETDVFLFIESDIFFTKKISDEVIECSNKNMIINKMYDHYFSICNNKNKIIYPHIWEGACLIPKKFISLALEDGVNLGSKKSWFIGRESLAKEYYTFYRNKFYNLFDIISSNDFKTKNLGSFETLFEFEFYCFINNFPTNICDSPNCEIGDKVVHFRGADSFVMNFNHKDICLVNSTIKENSIWNNYINNCSFLFFINGELKKDKNLKMCLLKNSNNYFEKKIKMITIHANEWMNKKELEKLNLIKIILNE